MDGNVDDDDSDEDDDNDNKRVMWRGGSPV